MDFAYRGFVLNDGTIIGWPTLLFDHNAAMQVLGHDCYRARWRQWQPDEGVDFDAGTTAEDKQRVKDWVEYVQIEGSPTR